MSTCHVCGTTHDNAMACTNCGTPVAPAAAGNPLYQGLQAPPPSPPPNQYGGYPTAPAPQQPNFQQPMQPNFGPPGAPNYGTPPPNYGAPNALLANPSGAPKKRTGRFIAIALGAVAVAVVAVIAVMTLSDNSDSASGGAASPEDVVTGLIDAVHNEDPLAMVDLLEPREQNLIADSVRELQDVATGQQTTGAASDAYEKAGIGALDPNDLFPGFNVTFTNVEVATEPLGDNFQKVVLKNFNADWTFSAQEFENVVNLSEMDDDLDLENVTGSADIGDLQGAITDNLNRIDEPFVVTTKVDGQWYLSLELTALEMIRIEADLGPAEWGDLGSAQQFGAETPAAAFTGFIEATLDGRPDQMIEFLDPNRYESLYRFRNSFPDFNAADQLQVEFDIMDVEAVKDDRGTVLALDGSTITQTETSSFDTSYQTTVYSFDRDCVKVTREYFSDFSGETEELEPAEACWGDLGDLADDLDNGMVDEMGIDFDWLRNVQDIDSLWVNVSEVDGRWFFDPIQTGVSYGSLLQAASEGG